MNAHPRFLALLDELERYQLPARHRLNPGEAVGGKARAVVSMSASATAICSPPTPAGGISAKLIIRSAIRVGVLRHSEVAALSAPVERPKAVKIVRDRKPKIVQPKAPRQPRSAEAIASAAAKVRAQRQSRVDTLLPLVEEARRAGCKSLSAICQWLDDIGHKPERCAKWSAGTLSQMLPAITEEERQAREADRKARDSKFARLIAEARADGASSNDKIADWLNVRGYRTATDLAWTSTNISRFRRETEESRAAHVERLPELFAEAGADGATSDSKIANWLNARGIKSANGSTWEWANVGYFRRKQM